MFAGAAVHHVEHSPATTSRSVVVAGPEGLEVIHEPDVNTCLWSRPLHADFAAALTSFSMSRGPVESSLAVSAGEPLELRLGSLIETLVLPAPLQAAVLLDVLFLVGVYASLARPPVIRVTVGLVADDSCRRFHTDQIGLRLVCTYAGPGTECAPDSAVARSALGQHYASNDLANLAIVPRGRAVRRAGVGDVVLLKGDDWPGNRGRGAVHRSPPIEDLGLRRLVLVVNTPPGVEG